MVRISQKTIRPLNEAVDQEIELANRILTEFCRPYFGMKPFNNKPWAPAVRISWDKKMTVSKGGLDRREITTKYGEQTQYVPYMSIIATHCNNDGPFSEYAHYNNDPDIGYIPFTTWKQRVWALVAHEITHVVQHSLIRNHHVEDYTDLPDVPCFQYYKGKVEPGHGEFFQYIYRIIRKKFVNNHEYKNYQTNTPATLINRNMPKVRILSAIDKKTQKHVRGIFNLLNKHEENGVFTLELSDHSGKYTITVDERNVLFM